MRPKHLVSLIAALTLLAAACGGDDDSADTTTASEATAETTAADDASDAPDDSVTEPVTGPATITASDQSGDGTSVSVASVSVPTDGFVVVHADGGGSPGPILGWSDLLPAGDNTDVVVELREPLAESAIVYPMAHVDANGNGEYEFMPPDVTIDVPATTADGAVAVLPINYDVATTGGDASSAGLQLAASDLGEILVDASGYAVYLFTPDAQGESTCYDECEASWPIVAEVTAVGDGLDEPLLGTTTRTNGDVQATYNGWPLYYFAGDATAGDVNGQGLNGVWWVIDAAGDAIES
jgi:predicted lipoprotein with Yx(FWY)xxD motif